MSLYRLVLQLVMAAILYCLASCGTQREAATTNRLGNAGSPYLREHADNPVDWYEWGDEALEKAQREGKPLLISIGYASCHWCHVMERETFMDTAVARIMNENFVSIKIDREERPDIDQIYLNAAQLITGNAGWPLNAFALPDGRPFFAATYFPKDQWIQLLNKIIDTYANDAQTIRKQAASVTKGIQISDQFSNALDSTAENQVDYTDIKKKWLPYFDDALGGLRGAPKFPMPIVWEYLLQHHYLTGDTSSLKQVTTTLDQMSAGGIYDQLRGGFARYSTDSLWRVPHFEKMLYDNAQLVSLYAQAFQFTRDEQYKNVLIETLNFINEELTSSEGTFYSSINADSEGQEGKFYAWSKKEIDDVLDQKFSRLMTDVFHVTAGGNWESNTNILFRSSSVGSNDSKSLEVLNEARRELLVARNKRVRPTTDDKVLTSWNALMIEAYVYAFFAIKDPKYLERATTCASYLLNHRVDKNGHLWRVRDDKHIPIDAFLDDYALLSRAYIKLYQATFDVKWLESSKLIADYALSNFKQKDGELFYYSLDKSAQQIVSKVEVSDEVIPSSNSVLAEVFLLLGEYYQNDRYQKQAKAMITRMSGTLTSGGPYVANWAKLVGYDRYQPYEIAIMGFDATAKRNELAAHYLPTSVWMGGDKENLPLLENKLVAGKTLIYVCRNRTCKFPVENVDEALKLLR